MTLLRRAPREVYRVYSEEEFFAHAVADEQSSPQVSAGTGWRHRALGATTLLAAVGAVGGLVAVTLLAPSTRSGRRSGSLFAATGSFAGTRLQSTRVWHQADRAVGSRRPHDAVRWAAPARVARRAALARATIAARLDRVAAHERVAQAAAAASEGAQVAAAVRSDATMRAATGSDASPPRGEASEFGFER